MSIFDELEKKEKKSKFDEVEKKEKKSKFDEVEKKLATKSDHELFYCSQKHEIDYVTSLYTESEKVKEFLIAQCNNGTIKNFTHADVYALIKKELGYSRNYKVHKSITKQKSLIDEALGFDLIYYDLIYLYF